MGLSYHVVCVPASAGHEAATAFPIAPETAEANAWHIFGSDEYAAVENAAVRIARERQVPAVSAWIFDDDFGCILGIAPGGTPGFLIALGEPYDVEDDPLGHALARQWASTDERRQHAEAAAEWSDAHAPSVITAEDVLAAYDDDDLYAAQHALNTIFGAMGLPRPYDAMARPQPPRASSD